MHKWNRARQDPRARPEGASGMIGVGTPGLPTAGPPTQSWVALVLLMLASGQGCAPRTVRLRFTPQQGESFKVRTTHHQLMAITYGAFKEEGLQVVTSEEHCEVRSVDSAGIAQLKTTMASFQVNMDHKGSRAIYDSRFPSRHRSLRTLPFELALGQHVHYSVDRTGKLVRFKGAQDAIMQRLAVRTGELRFTPEITEQSLRISILERFGDAALREAFAQNFIVLPERALRVGDRWKREVRVSKGIPMIIAVTYTLGEISPHQVVVTADATIRSNPAVPYTDLGTQDIKYLIEGTQTSRYTINPQSGWTIRSKMKHNISGRFGLQQHPPPDAIVAVTRNPWNYDGTITINGISRSDTLQKASTKAPAARHPGVCCSAAL